jgi:MFS family permease
MPDRARPEARAPGPRGGRAAPGAEGPPPGVGARPPAPARRPALRPELALAAPVFATRLVYLATLTLLPPLLVQRGVSPALLGLLVGAYGYAAVGMGLVAGVLVDRFAPARLAIVGSGGVVVAIGALLASTHAVPMALARLLHGVAMGLFRPSVTALVVQRVPPERRASAVATNNLAYVAGGACGPLLAGLLADRVGLEGGLAAAAGIAALAWAYLLRFRRAPRPASAAPVPLLASLRGLPALVRARGLLAPIAVVLADMTILHVWLVFLPLYLVQVHGYSLALAGALVTIEALGYALAQAAWGRLLDRRGPRLGLSVSLVAHGLCIALVPLVGGEWAALAVLLALCGALNAGAYPGAVTVAACRVAEEERGRALGLLASASDLGQIVGPLLGSAAYALSGRYEPAFVLTLGVALAGLLPGRR